MPLWGAGTSVDHKPRFLTDVQKRDVYANTSGWVTPGVGRGTTDPEVLVAIRNLSKRDSATDPSGTGLALANITSINWNTTSAELIDGQMQVSATVNFNEAVFAQGAGMYLEVQVTNSDPVNLEWVGDSAAGGQNTNRLNFESPAGWGGMTGGPNIGESLSIGANAVTLNGTVLREYPSYDECPDAHLSSAAIGTAAGAIGPILEGE